jgi:hypothetical protein
MPRLRHVRKYPRIYPLRSTNPHGLDEDPKVPSADLKLFPAQPIICRAFFEAFLGRILTLKSKSLLKYLLYTVATFDESQIHLAVLITCVYVPCIPAFLFLRLAFLGVNCYVEIQIYCFEADFPLLVMLFSSCVAGGSSWSSCSSSSSSS